MEYRFVCPGIRATKGFRHHLYCETFPAPCWGDVSEWLELNVGERDKDWKHLPVHNLRVDGERLYGVSNAFMTGKIINWIFVFRRKEDAMAFKMRWG